MNTWHYILVLQKQTHWELSPILGVFLLGVLTVVIFILVTLFFNLYYRTKLYRLKSGFHAMLSPQINSLSSLRAAMPVIVKELDRSRRYQRTLSVVVLRLEDNNGSIYKNGHKVMPNRQDRRFDVDMHFMHHVQLGFLIMGSILRDSLRQCDLATYDSQHNQFILLLPETNLQQARKVVLRLNRLFFKRMLFQLQAGIAEFPEQGIVFDDLMAKAVQDSKPVNDMNIKVKKNSKEFKVSVNS
ncbi:hypothetical protein GF406_18395 [candidate division KSB1 bacterium]|nr:hypothetical protein [candidate division KSB1 bacterium]